MIDVVSFGKIIVVMVSNYKIKKVVIRNNVSYVKIKMRNVIIVIVNCVRCSSYVMSNRLLSW